MWQRRDGNSTANKTTAGRKRDNGEQRVSQDGLNSQYNGSYADGGDLRVFYVALDETIVEGERTQRSDRRAGRRKGMSQRKPERNREWQTPGVDDDDEHAKPVAPGRVLTTCSDTVVASLPRLHRVATACKLRASLASPDLLREIVSLQCTLGTKRRRERLESFVSPILLH